MKQFEPKPLTYFYLSRATACPYIDGREEQMIFTDLSAAADPHGLHQHLSVMGFRRSQAIAYKPNCTDCQACIAIRIRANENQLNKTQRRIRNRNNDLTARVLPAAALSEHYELFQIYVESRHGDSSMANMGFDEYMSMIEETPVTSQLVEFRKPDGRLHSVCLSDQMADGFSLVYSFFDPQEANRSPGIHMILWHINRARQLDLPYVYLGYWIEESRKMAYKSQFKHSEIFVDGRWQNLTPR